MFSNKSCVVLVLASCLFAFIAAEQLPLPLVRHQRSPDHNTVTLDAHEDRFGRRMSAQYSRDLERGSASITASRDPSGRQLSGQYNQNLYTSPDGRGTIDAYANANRNFDHNRNDFGGGIQGRLHF